MDSYEQIKKDLLATFNFDKLGFNAGPLAIYIMEHRDWVPFNLVYKNQDGKLETDHKIREDLSSLIGFELSYMPNPNEKKDVVILFKTITEKTLTDEGCLKNATIGKLRSIAKTIHPEAKLINENLAASLWCYARQYYVTKFLLGKNGFEIPDIQILSSSEESDNEESPFMNWNSSCGRWEYLDEEGGSGRIEGGLPVLCYIERKRE